MPPAKTVYNPTSPVFAPSGGASIFERFGYSAAVRAGGLVFAAGQIGLNPDGSMPQDDETQFVNAFERLKLVLEAAGCGMQDLVELVTYHVGLHAHLPAFMEVKQRYVPEPFPTWTILEVAALARAGLVIEIKAVAAARG